MYDGLEMPPHLRCKLRSGCEAAEMAGERPVQVTEAPPNLRVEAAIMTQAQPWSVLPLGCEVLPTPHSPQSQPCQEAGSIL